MDKFTDEDTLNDVLAVLKKEHFPQYMEPEPIDDILDEPDKTPQKWTDASELDDQFKELLKKINTSLFNNTSILDEAALLVKTVGDDKTLEAYASVAKSNSELLKTFASTLLDRQKMLSTEKMKKDDMALKEKLANLKSSAKEVTALPAGTYIQNNITLKATRDEMFKMIYGKPEDREKVIASVMESNPDIPLMEAETVEIK